MTKIFKEIKTESKVPTYKYLVEGEWQESRNRKLINIFSPIDGSLLGRIQSVLPREADIAVTGAAMAQTSWASLSPSKRNAILAKTASLILKNKDFLAKLLTKEIGKLKKDAEAEIDHAVYVIKETLKEKWQEKLTLKIGKSSCEITRQPLGVVLCITPFNYPIYTACTKIVPALISGNSVVLKPSVFGSISTFHLVQLFKKAGLPAGVLNVITGRGDEIGWYLAQHDLINMLSFTGSSKVGRKIAERAKMVNMTLELGGKDPAIVLKDADLSEAASEIVEGAFAYAGQRCMAIKRVIAEKEIKDELVDKIKEMVLKKFGIVGDPRNEKTQLGPVISDQQADYLEKLVNDALKKGARVVLGGKRFVAVPLKMRLRRRILEIPKRLIRLRRGNGRYWEATVLDNVTPSMRIAWEEQFGPILPILSVKNAEEAVNLANASEYGLDAAIFTSSHKKAQKLAEKLEVGQVFINTRPHRAPDHLPFTGVKASGLGTQGIKYSILSMTRPKMLRRDV